MRQKKRRLSVGMFASSISLGLIIAVGIVFLDIRQTPISATARPSKPVANAVLADTVSDGQAPLTSFLPEQDDLGGLLLQKLAIPPAPPTPDCTARPCVALTFDDGPDPASTPKILDALDKENVKGTFFVIGNRVAASAPLVQRMNNDGQSIGNHSWAHPDFTKLTAAQMTQQVDETQKAIASIGVPAPVIFRPPYGSRNNLVRQTIKLPIIMWNVDPKDWSQKDPEKFIQLVESQAKPGAIILMHDRVATSQAIATIIHDLKQKYELVTVQQLLGLKPNSQGEFTGR